MTPPADVNDVVRRLRAFVSELPVDLYYYNPEAKLKPLAIDAADLIEQQQREIERLQAQVTETKLALFPPETPLDNGPTIIHDADKNLDAAIYALEQRGADKVCIGVLKNVMDKLLQARAALTGHAKEK